MNYRLRRTCVRQGYPPGEDVAPMASEAAGRQVFRESLERIPLRPGELIELLRTDDEGEVDILVRQEHPESGGGGRVQDS